ncbi:hypothetical protein POM88_001472 [Heracleum sosnowskyi]|uniref:Uncharacterized protein n=1 Tax=Heracleum sosnowskyi TaxID=360622 RepID=A0AAD8NAF9_9APIA|nr:hypothetical protein POM88_001472 [Heracleum sosnowskyi]
MRSPSWTSNASVIFWKNSTFKQGVVLSKNYVVADMTLIEKAVKTCKEKYRVVEKTQATIDSAMIEGIPSNIDLFKELALPLTVIAKFFNKRKRWEEPYLTASFLAITYTLVLSVIPLTNKTPRKEPSKAGGGLNSRKMSKSEAKLKNLIL